ncbi:hypothetical protein Tco_1432610, partial [Tanacetum coccineum]
GKRFGQVKGVTISFWIIPIKFVCQCIETLLEVVLKFDPASAFADLGVLELFYRAVHLEVSLVVDGFLEDSNSLVLLLVVFLPWFGPAEGSSSSSSSSSYKLELVGGSSDFLASSFASSIFSASALAASVSYSSPFPDSLTSAFDISSSSSSFTSSLPFKTFSSSETPGLVQVPSLELAKTNVDSSGTPGILPVPSLEPPVPGYLLLVFLFSFRAFIVSAASSSSSAASVKLIDLPSSKVTSGSGMILSAAEIVTFFLTTLLLAVSFLMVQSQTL